MSQQINLGSVTAYASAKDGGYVGTYAEFCTDLANSAELADTIRTDSMPTASSENVGDIVQFIGTTTSSYTHGFFYECQESGGAYSWVNLPVSEGGGSESLAELSDTNIYNPINGDSLIYDDSQSKWVNKAVITKILVKPTVTNLSFTYNGNEQGPTITGLDSDWADYITITNATAINAGTYTLTFAIKNTNTTMWNDLTTQNITYTWSIAKANGSITLSANSVTLDVDYLSRTVTFSDATGNVSVSSSDITIATASISGSTITISSVNNKAGNVVVTVSVDASENYNATNKTITVIANFAKLVSWTSGSNTEITDMINAYYNGFFTLDQIKSVWSVGDVRNISLSAMSATGVSESHHAQTVQMVILDFDHDTLSAPINGIQKALISVQTKNLLRDATHGDTEGSANSENGYMNSSDTTSGAWENCARRTWCNNVFYGALPSWFKNLVKQVDKLSGIKNSVSPKTTHDYCWLISEVEIFDANSYSYVGEGTQYSYYSTASNRVKLPRYQSSDPNMDWWLRSGASSSSFAHVWRSGTSGALSAPASYRCGLSPACSL